MESGIEFTQEILQIYLHETRNICLALKKDPMPRSGVSATLLKCKNNSALLEFTPVASLCGALYSIYEICDDGKITFTENIADLVKLVAVKIEECCTFIETHAFKKPNPDELEEKLSDIDIHLYLLYCDKAVTGEMFSAEDFNRQASLKKAKRDFLSHKQQEAEQKTDEIIKIKSSDMAQIINAQEEMIARTYIISNQIELLKNAIADGDTHSLKDTYKLLQSDSQTLQNSILLSHDQFISLMHDDSFLKSHQELQGFFVYANGEKYLVPSQFIFDVICASPLDYVMRQNQKYVVYVREDETGTQEEKEEIPVYALSSLLPGQPVAEGNVLDTILLADYQEQHIGIIVESMQKFVSIIKKPMPEAFENFLALQGVAFDEKYDMVPILYLPEIMKKFRSLRGYDVKKFEAYSKKHVNKILVVDDSKTTRQIQETILTGSGYLVDLATDGIDAMEKIRKKQFDLIVCDDVMPRMNGEIFVDNVRRMENYAKVPIIALSESPIEQTNAFVGKSDFSREKLIHKIQEVLHE